MMKRLLVVPIMLLALCSLGFGQDLAQQLQDVSVTVKSGMSEGSGVLITRNIKTDGDKVEKINFVWTAGHVIDNLRSVRTIIRQGKPVQVVEFKDVQIVQELVEQGRRVGEIKMDAKVLKFSHSENGEDLALLMVRKKNFVDKNSVFLDSDDPVSIGKELYHVGSLLGQQGSNSMTRGIMSQIGRVLNLGSGDGVIFDQTTVTAFPGSSGGGVFLTERSGDDAGKYVGMLVRGAGETFNFIVPVRRMRKWAREQDVLWALDEKEASPSYDEILHLPIESSGTGSVVKGEKRVLTKDSQTFPVLIHQPKIDDKEYYLKIGVLDFH